MNYFERRRQSLQNYYSDDYNDQYINNIVTEAYLEDEYVFEGIGDMVDSLKEKVNNAINKIKELWNKFKAWISNLFNVVVNMFKSGAKLVSEHESDIREAYARKKNTIEYNGHLYRLNNIDGMMKMLNELTDSAITTKDIRDDMDETKKHVDMVDKVGENEIISGITDGAASDKQSFLKLISQTVKHPEQKKYKLSSININDIIDVAGNGKEVMKTIKETRKNTDKFFKERIGEINSMKSEYSEDKDAIKIIDATVKQTKTISGLLSAAMKQLIADVKEGNRAYTALVRKLLDGRIKGSDDNDNEAPKNEAPKNEEPKNEEPKTDTAKPDPNGGNRGLRGAKRYVELQKQKTNNGRQSKYHK